jgi:hypothetical protein
LHGRATLPGSGVEPQRAAARFRGRAGPAWHHARAPWRFSTAPPIRAEPCAWAIDVAFALLRGDPGRGVGSSSHELDEASPLHGRDQASNEADTLRFIASFTGLDATVLPTVHARHIYEHGDVPRRRRFVDMSTTPRHGRLRVDYQRFHDTVRIDPSHGT